MAINPNNKNIKVLGLRELQAAVKRNPQTVLEEGEKFLIRGLAVYKRGIINDPWRVGGDGGGAPVSNDPRYKRKDQEQRSGNLRDTHLTKIDGLKGIIGPNQRLAPYAEYVHDGTPGGQMAGRPWLEYVKSNKDDDIEDLYLDMLNNIVSDLAA